MFKSQAQVEKFRELVRQGKMSQSTFDEWMTNTPRPDELPGHVAPSPKSSPFVRTTRSVKVMK